MSHFIAVDSKSVDMTLTNLQEHKRLLMACNFLGDQ